ncbi:hypothetical protein PWT90_00451 [Aphanocladium album]|nr:hypothetical protein PWT90_00451 [Aphanocladium album]
MKLSIIACALTGALAINPSSLLAVRDASTITSILSDVKKNLESLDSAVKGYTGDKSTVLKASNDLISTLKDGKTKVDASSELDLNDAVTLTGPVQDLTKTGETLASDLQAFKSTVEKEGECTLVRTQVNNVNDASQALIKAVISKVPQEAQQIASQLAAGLTKVLSETVDDFSEQNCKDSSSGGGSPSSTDSPSATSSTPAASSNAPTTTASQAPGTSTTASAGPAPTSGASKPSSSTVPVVTAGAAAMAPLGAAAIAVAALML